MSENEELMSIDYSIPEPFQFNPLKHHLAFIREFINHVLNPENHDIKEFIRQIKHTGSSVMDIYTGLLSINKILAESKLFLEAEGLITQELFSYWTGKGFSDFRIITLSDSSQWTLKYHNSENRYVHLFPTRSSPHTFRIKANTLKSAVLYVAVIGKDYVTEEDLNRARAMADLSPVKEVAETEAVSEMIEILRTPV
jgi:hypothetical protein